MALHDANGTLIAQSTSIGDTEFISLNNQPAGVYYVRAYGFQGATNPRYSLSFQTPELSITADRFEPNNEATIATQLRELEGTRTLEGLSLHSSADVDWFEFKTTADSDSRHVITVNFEHALGDIDIYLTTISGEIVATSTGVGNRETISLAGLTAGSYRLQVYGYLSATNPNYSITFDTPTALSPADSLEANNTRATAADFRSVQGEMSVNALSIHDANDVDWFRFETSSIGGAADHVQINFQHTLGDLDARLYNSAGELVLGSYSIHDEELLPLANLPAGVYFVEVYGYAGASNPNYDLIIDAPEVAALLADRFEANETPATASQLRTQGDQLVGGLDVENLSIHVGTDLDYFRFTTAAVGSSAHLVTISYEVGGGALTLQLLDSNGQVVGVSSSGTGSESISLAALPAGNYTVRVAGANASAVNRYRLHIDAPNAISQGTKDAWTIMVYLTASDLAEFAFDDINEMENAAARLPASVNIAVLWDQSALEQIYATGGGTQAAWSTSGRAFIQPDTNSQSIATRFDISAEVNTGDPNTLAGFIQWATTNAPAERYALIGWDHGAGIFGSNYDNADQAADDNLEINEWLDALTRSGVPDLDLLSFDACLMAMAEIGYTLRNEAQTFVASEEVVAGEGYDYRTLFNSLIVNPYAVTAEALATGFVQSYQASTATQLNTDTESAIRTSSYPNLAAALRAFTDSTASLSTSALSSIARAMESSISYSITEFRDLGSIMRGVASISNLPAATRQAASDVLAAIEDAVILRTNDDRRSSGIAVYVPDSGNTGQFYRTEFAAFDTATGWSNMLSRIGTISSGRVTPGGRFTAFASTSDWAESNDIAAQATNLFQLSGDGVTLSNLSLHSTDDEDWYRFSIGSAGQAGHQIAASAAGAALQLELYAAASTSSPLLVSQGTSPSVSLAGLAAGSYFLHVASPSGSAVSNYQLTSSAPRVATRGRLGDNTTEDKAFPLGLVGNHVTIPSLRIDAASNGWYTVETPRLPEPQWFTIEVSAAADANLSIVVLDATGNIVSQDSGAGNLIVGYLASGGSESYSIHMTNQGSAATTYNLSIERLTGTIEDLLIPERWIGSPVDALPLNELVNQVGQVTVGDSRFEFVNGTLQLRTGQVLSASQAHSVFVPMSVSDAAQPGRTVSFVLPVLVESNPFPFHNTTESLNVNNDINPRTGLPAITAIDALLIINELNRIGGHRLGNRNASPTNSDPFFDVNKDDFVAPLDALLIINYLNTHPSGEGEYAADTFQSETDAANINTVFAQMVSVTVIEARMTLPWLNQREVELIDGSNLDGGSQVVVVDNSGLTNWLAMFPMIESSPHRNSTVQQSLFGDEELLADLRFEIDGLV